MKGTLGEALLADRHDYFQKNIAPGKDSDQVYSISHIISIPFRNPHVLVLATDNYGDYGGAHGLYNETFVNIDLDHHKRLSLEDVLDAAAAANAFVHILEMHYRKDYKMKPGAPLGDNLLVDTIPLTGNFFITGSGITFNYGPYGIASYANGEQHVFVPYKEITAWFL